jgi:acid phosphatase (class A)
MGLNPVNHRIYLASAKFGEAPAGGRAAVLPGTFALMVIERGAGQAKAAPPKSAQYLSASQIDPSRLLPAPPADGSEIQQHEMAEVRRLIETRTPERLAQAKWDADHEDPTPFAAVLGPSFDLAKLPATAKLLSAVIKDSNAAASAAKEFFHRKFPVAAANPEAYEKWTCDTPARKPGDRPLRSYPSGHTTLGYTLGTVLANLVPENAQAILARAKEYGYSRQICGDHYQSDTEAGHVLGTAIGLELLSSEGLRPMLDAARQELRAAGIAK